MFGITSLTIGGAERVLVDVCNKLSDMYDITIFSIYDNGELKKELSNNVKFEALYAKRYCDMPRALKLLIPIKILFFSKWIYKKKISKDYDTEIAFLEGPITRLFSNKSNKVKKVAWIHNDISRVFGKGIKSNLKKHIDKNVYQKYDELVFVSKDNMENFQKYYKGFDSSRMQVIYNYIDKEKVKKKAEEKYSDEMGVGIKCVTVCRLVNQKALDRLIRVHSKLIRNGIKHKFFIIGDGPERENLEKIIKKENVVETFVLMGQKSNPYPYMKNADYFCLLSNYEGYGMVLEEAKILNKKIIITDTAARECIENYKDGIVLENEESKIYEGLYNIFTHKTNTKINKEFIYDNSDKLSKIINLLNG